MSNYEKRKVWSEWYARDAESLLAELAQMYYPWPMTSQVCIFFPKNQTAPLVDLQTSTLHWAGLEYRETKSIRG